MKKLCFLFIAVIGLIVYPASFIQAQGGVSFSLTGLPPDSSAGLDVNFITKGALLPRMTTAQRNAISNPAIGLTIFNTDCKVYNYNAGTPENPNWATMNASNV